MIKSYNVWENTRLLTNGNQFLIRDDFVVVLTSWIKEKLKKTLNGVSFFFYIITNEIVTCLVEKLFYDRKHNLQWIIMTETEWPLILDIVIWQKCIVIKHVKIYK